MLLCEHTGKHRITGRWNNLCQSPRCSLIDGRLAEVSHFFHHLFVFCRMLLLDSLQSKLLRCKLLELLLDYACPKKLAVPMSLTLLLHFMKNCTLAPDPTVTIQDRLHLLNPFYLFEILKHMCKMVKIRTLLKRLCWRNWTVFVFNRTEQKGGWSGKSWSICCGCCCSATIKQWKVSWWLIYLFNWK